MIISLPISIIIKREANRFSFYYYFCLRLLLSPTNPKIANPNPANAEFSSAIPVLGNTFSPALATGAFGASGVAGTSGVDGFSGRSAGVSFLGVTVTGTSTSMISPVGNLTLTLTLAFCPAVSVVGISPTSTISAPFGNSTCLITSSLVIGVPTSTTIGVVFYVGI